MDSGASGRPAACAAMTARDGAIVARREAVTMRGALTRAGVAPRRRAGATARRTTSSQSHPMASRDARGAAAGTGMAAGAVTRDGNAETAGGVGGGSDRGVAASTSAAVSGTPTKSAAARPADGSSPAAGRPGCSRT